jgi:hypothetical protein
MISVITTTDLYQKKQPGHEVVLHKYLIIMKTSQDIQNDTIDELRWVPATVLLH